MKPLTITLADEADIRAVIDSLLINLVDTNAKTVRYQEACDRIMTEVCDSAPQTPLDEKKIISAVSALRDLNDELRRSLQFERDDKERVQKLYQDAFDKADRYHNLICGAVTKLSKRNIKRGKIADHLARSLQKTTT
jgi:hypothetical protein